MFDISSSASGTIWEELGCVVLLEMLFYWGLVMHFKDLLNAITVPPHSVLVFVWLQ